MIQKSSKCGVDVGDMESKSVCHFLTVTIFVMKYQDQKHLQEENVILLLLASTMDNSKKSGQALEWVWNFEAEAEDEAIDGCCLMSCSSWFVLPACL